MKAVPCTEAGESHYEVLSPEMMHYGYGYDPPEYGCDWGVFLAPTAKAAKVLAVKSSDFADWVKEARGDCVPPFKGLKASLSRCEHGVCWGCDDNLNDDESNCGPCNEAMEAHIAAENAV